MDVPRNFLYTRDHLWIKPEGNRSRIGVTDYSQEELGDVVFIDLPDPGDDVQMAAPFGIIESGKAVADLIAPITGEIAEVNSGLTDSPELINEDPYGEGWLVSIQMSEPDQIEILMPPEEYEDYIAGLGDIEE